MIIRRQFTSLLAIHFLHRKLVLKKMLVKFEEACKCTGEIKKIGAVPKDEGEDITGEIHFPTLLILRFLNSWNTKLA